MIALILLGAAVAVALWPTPPAGGRLLPVPGRPSTPAAPAPPTAVKRPDFRSAIDSLAYVRSRLSATDSLDDKAKAAIDVLTLALVAGSDAE
jgi:hypothetical protein